MNSLTIEFTHHGQRRTLAKHPKVRHALKHGKITLDQAKQYPWYLRFKILVGEKLKDRSFKMVKRAKDQVLVEARDFLNNRSAKPNEFQAFIAARDAAKSVTIGQLSELWTSAGLPFHATKKRDAAAVKNLSGFLARALVWWADKPVASIKPHFMQDYAGTRADALRGADLELNALSCLCNWAQLAGRIPANPFAKRPRFAETKQHCHEACPDNDEIFHKVIAWLFETPVHNSRTPEAQNIIAGALLCFCGLSGLRPGEPKFLQKLPPLASVPTGTATLAAGTIFPDRTGQLRMKVIREKRGQNPFITITKPLELFLSAWRAWLAANVGRLPSTGAPQLLFPLQTTDQTVFSRALNQASAALELPHYKPHGFGRAYYVRVRRSQGADDSTIAGELGQTTNGDLIRSVYGNPDDLHGGQMHDWLPAGDAPTAWAMLPQINLAQRRAQIEARRQQTRDTSKDTSGHIQDGGNVGQDGEQQNSQNPVPEVKRFQLVPPMTIS